MDESMEHAAGVKFEERQKSDFNRKAWMQTGQASASWVMARPKEHGRYNAWQIPVVAHLYFGVRHECLVGLVGQTIIHKTG